MNPDLLTETTLVMPHVMSLSMAGITTVFDNDAQTADATFSSTTGIARPLAVDGIVATVEQLTEGGVTTTVEDHLVEAFGGDILRFDATCYDYIAFGVGEQNDMIGRTMQTAPVHFAQQGAMGPTNRYNRYVTVFQVDKIGATGTTNLPGGIAGGSTGECSESIEPAKYIGSAMAMGQDHLFGLAHSMGHTYENIANQ